VHHSIISSPFYNVNSHHRSQVLPKYRQTTSFLRVTRLQRVTHIFHNSSFSVPCYPVFHHRRQPEPLLYVYLMIWLFDDMLIYIIRSIVSRACTIMSGLLLSRPCELSLGLSFDVLFLPLVPLLSYLNTLSLVNNSPNAYPSPGFTCDSNS